MTRKVLTILFLTALVTSGGCASGNRHKANSGGPRRFTYDLPALGTSFRILFYAPDAPAAERASAAAATRLADLDAKLNPDRPDSELRRLCDGAGGPPRKISDDLFVVLDAAQRIGQSSGGAFDATAGTYLQLWLSAAASGTEPPEAQLEAARPLVGVDKLRLEPIERTATLTVPSMRLDVAGVANGYAADAVIEALRRVGVERALVDAKPAGSAGRTVAAGGRPPGKKGWNLTVRGLAPTPAAARKRKKVGPVLLGIANAAVAFSPNAPAVSTGRPPAWLIDPLTAKPATDRPWALVIGRRGAWVAPLAAAAVVMGRESGAPLVRSSGAVVHFESVSGRSFGK
jgi:thiamine biosynthesis lipoprotein